MISYDNELCITNLFAGTATLRNTTVIRTKLAAFRPDGVEMAETARIEFARTFDLQGERIDIKHALIEADEYISFLARTNLGQQYPKERFNERIRVLVKSVQVSLIARNTDDEVVGVCFGLTDFAYWLFLTDLGIDRRYERRGIGKLLVESAHELAGGEKEIVLFANVNDEAIPFYNKLGMKQCSDIFAKWNIEWTSFEVGKDTLS